MSTELPWDRWKPEQAEPEPEPVKEPPYVPPVEPEPELPYIPPPSPNLPDRPALDVDFGQVLKDAFSNALVEAGTKLREGAKDYAKDSWEGIKKGQTVDILNPTVTAETKQGKQLIVADAKSRSWRTLVQGLCVDVIFAIVATVAMLTDMDPFVKETWIVFGLLLLKSVMAAIVSYFMRLKVQPTIKTPGQKMAVMPLPTRIEDEEWKEQSA